MGWGSGMRGKEEPFERNVACKYASSRNGNHVCAQGADRVATALRVVSAILLDGHSPLGIFGRTAKACYRRATYPRPVSCGRAPMGNL